MFLITTLGVCTVYTTVYVRVVQIYSGRFRAFLGYFSLNFSVISRLFLTNFSFLNYFSAISWLFHGYFPLPNNFSLLFLISQLDFPTVTRLLLISQLDFPTNPRLLLISQTSQLIPDYISHFSIDF